MRERVDAGDQRGMKGLSVGKGFAGDEENRELDCLLSVEPVEVLTDRADVISDAGVGELTGG